MKIWIYSRMSILLSVYRFEHLHLSNTPGSAKKKFFNFLREITSKLLAKKRIKPILQSSPVHAHRLASRERRKPFRLKRGAFKSKPVKAAIRHGKANKNFTN